MEERKIQICEHEKQINTLRLSRLVSSEVETAGKLVGEVETTEVLVSHLDITDIKLHVMLI